MKLISLKYREDWGHDWYVQVLHTKRWAVFQASVSWMESACWPYFQLKSGSGSLLSLLFWAWKIGFDIGLCERTWNWERMDEIDSASNVA